MPEAPLAELAARVFDAERAHKATARTREALRAELLQRMLDEPVGKLDMAGQGLITLLPDSSAETVDVEACEQKIAALAARLRELGDVDVDDTVPKRQSRRPAALRVTPRF